MPYYTNHKHKGAYHYACVDVLSVFSVDWKPYYTYHIQKGSLHYVCVDVLLDDAHHYVYHRNICTLHSVHEVVHSDYPGKKQRLNIRLHFDEMNHY